MSKIIRHFSSCAAAQLFEAKARRTPGVNYVKQYQMGWGKQSVMVCGEWDTETETALLEGKTNYA